MPCISHRPGPLSLISFAQRQPKPTTVARMTENQNPEQKARDNIDAQLELADWVIQLAKKVDFGAGPGIAVREYQTVFGPADYVLFVDQKAVGITEAKKEALGHKLTEAGKPKATPRPSSDGSTTARRCPSSTKAPASLPASPRLTIPNPARAKSSASIAQKRSRNGSPKTPACAGTQPAHPPAHHQRPRTHQSRDQTPHTRRLDLPQHRILSASRFRSARRVRRGVDNRQGLSQLEGLIYLSRWNHPGLFTEKCCIARGQSTQPGWFEDRLPVEAGADPRIAGQHHRELRAGGEEEPLGDRPCSRAFARQVAENHVRVALLNAFTDLACRNPFGLGELRLPHEPGWGEGRFMPKIVHVVQLCIRNI